MIVIKTRCEVCGKAAILRDASAQQGKPFYERVFVCPAQHTTKQAGGDKPDEPSALERLNRFLDELEGKTDA